MWGMAALCVLKAGHLLHHTCHVSPCGQYLNDAALWETASKCNVQCQSSRWYAFSADRPDFSLLLYWLENTQVGTDMGARQHARSSQFLRFCIAKLHDSASAKSGVEVLECCLQNLCL